MAVPLRKRVKRAVRSAVVAAAIRLLSVLPLRPALALGRLAGRLAWWLDRGDRRLMLEHLALAFPGKTDAERRAVARGCLVHLGQVAMEAVVVRRLAPRMQEYVTLAPGAAEAVERARSKGKGIVFIAGHLGNWELLARRFAVLCQPNAVIARRNGDERLNALVERARAEGGVKTLWREDPSTGRELIRLFRQGGGLGILIDQDTRVQGVFVPFFGQLAFTPRAAADLALRFRAAVLVVTSHRRGPLPGGGHELEATELGYDPAPADAEAEVQRLTAAAVALQEDAIRRYPEEWVWMHRRWKTRPPSEGSLASTVPKTPKLSGT